MRTGSGADIHNMICRTHRIFIMLDYDHGIAQIPQMNQCLQQLVIVLLVQTNTRLIEDISHAHQTGTDLRCQSNTLRFTAGQRCRTSGQTQIIQTNINQKLDSATNFPQQLAADQLLLLRQLHPTQEMGQIQNRHCGQLINILITDRHCQ